MRVLVVDDSAFMRKIISDIINSDPELTVVGTAFDGVNALEKISSLKPDVVTLDVSMPRMDGLAALERIMNEHPIPVVMLSSLTQEGADATFKALNLGAIDYVAKPTAQGLHNLDRVKDELIAKLKIASRSNPVRHKETPFTPIRRTGTFKERVIVVAASTGGPSALEEILTRLPEDVPPILIVQHMPEGFTKHFAKRLDNVCKFHVKEGEETDTIQSGRALIAPAGHHMTVGEDSKIHLDASPEINYVRPAADPLMETAAKYFQSSTIGVILTGMGKDGAEGMKAIKQYGGMTIAQDKSTSIVFSMPKSAIELNCIDKILPLPDIPEEIVRICQKQLQTTNQRKTKNTMTTTQLLRP